MIKFNLITPMDILWDLQRKFKEYKGLLTTEIEAHLETSIIKLSLPILREPNFMNILHKLLNFFKNKTKTMPKPVYHPLSKPKSKAFTSKNYYSLTVSRKSSAFASNDQRNDEEFFEAYDDLEDLLIHQGDSSLNNSHIITENQLADTLKRKNANKANKIMNYFKEKELTLIQLQNFIEIKIEIHCPEILIEVFIDKFFFFLRKKCKFFLL